MPTHFFENIFGLIRVLELFRITFLLSCLSILYLSDGVSEIALLYKSRLIFSFAWYFIDFFESIIQISFKNRLFKKASFGDTEIQVTHEELDQHARNNFLSKIFSSIVIFLFGLYILPLFIGSNYWDFPCLIWATIIPLTVIRDKSDKPGFKSFSFELVTFILIFSLTSNPFHWIFLFHNIPQHLSKVFSNLAKTNSSTFVKDLYILSPIVENSLLVLNLIRFPFMGIVSILKIPKEVLGAWIFCDEFASFSKKFISQISDFFPENFSIKYFFIFPTFAISSFFPSLMKFIFQIQDPEIIFYTSILLFFEFILIFKILEDHLNPEKGAKEKIKIANFATTLLKLIFYLLVSPLNLKNITICSFFLKCGILGFQNRENRPVYLMETNIEKAILIGNIFVIWSLNLICGYLSSWILDYGIQHLVLGCICLFLSVFSTYKLTESSKVNRRFGEVDW